MAKSTRIGRAVSFVRALVAAETAYTFYERVRQLWRSLPSSVREAVKYGLFMVLSQSAVWWAAARGWVDGWPDYVRVSVAFGSAVILAALMLRVVGLKFIEHLEGRAGMTSTVARDVIPVTETLESLPETKADPDSYRTAALLRVAGLWSEAQYYLWNLFDHTFRAARDKGHAEKFVVDLIDAHLMGNRQKELMTMVTNTIRNKRRLTIEESEEGAALLMEALEGYYALANALTATSGFLVPADAPCSEEYGKVRESGNKLAEELARLEHTDLDRLAWRQDIRTVLLECNEPDGE